VTGTTAESRRRTISPVAVAALATLNEPVSAAGLVRRLAEAGAKIDVGRADSALAELADLGLARVARSGRDGPEFVATTLGSRVVDGRFLDAATGGALEELERLRTDLLATIAHELRTPLTVVRTAAGLLRDPVTEPSAEQRRTMLETIERNAERMQRLVADILDLARFRAGSIRLQLRPFDASELARSVVSAIRPLAAQRRQRLLLATPPDGGPTVFGDHRRLEQALLNLVSNAQRFAPDGGTIDVAVVAPGDGERVAWTVTDDGPGIPLDEQARLFERFFVGRSDENRAREGTGLGLPTALAIAQSHGGTVDVDSEPGRGSTFTLVVPVRGPADAGDDAG
jgi:signal transduction histidine kinase